MPKQPNSRPRKRHDRSHRPPRPAGRRRREPEPRRFAVLGPASHDDTGVHSGVRAGVGPASGPERPRAASAASATATSPSSRACPMARTRPRRGSPRRSRPALARWRPALSRPSAPRRPSPAAIPAPAICPIARLHPGPDVRGLPEPQRLDPSDRWGEAAGAGLVPRRRLFGLVGQQPPLRRRQSGEVGRCGGGYGQPPPERLRLSVSGPAGGRTVRRFRQCRDAGSGPRPAMDSRQYRGLRRRSGPGHPVRTVGRRGQGFGSDGDAGGAGTIPPRHDHERPAGHRGPAGDGHRRRRTNS
jgi:hypothetical protein